MEPYDWRQRDECARREQAERDKRFDKTVSLARKQSLAIKIMLDEDEHQQRRDEMRSAYLQYGTEFDPCQIQGGVSQSRHFEEIAGTPQASRTLNTGARRRDYGPGDDIIQGLPPPPQLTLASQRSAADILGPSPPRSPEACPPAPGSPQPTRASPPQEQLEDMELTPAARPQPPRVSPLRPEHQALLERVRRTVEEASRRLNITPSTSVHPLSHSFSSHSRKPLSTLYMNPEPGPSTMIQSSPVARPAAARSMPSIRVPLEGGSRPGPQICPTAPSDDPQLQFMSRVAQAPPASRAAPTSMYQPTPAAGPRTMPTVQYSQPPAAAMTMPTPQPGPSRPAAAGGINAFRGTQREMEALGFHGRDDRETMEEWQFADKHITPYTQPAPQIEGQIGLPSVPGLLKRPGAEGGPKKRVMLKRKVVKITIPPRPDTEEEEGRMPYMYGEGDPQYGVAVGPLLPPRRLTPSPPQASGEQRIRSRLELEADWQRRQEATPSRDYPGDKKQTFGKPLPKSFTTGRPKKLPSYRGGAQGSSTPQPTPSTSFGFAMGGAGRPQTPTTRTGLVLRTPSSSPGPTSSSPRAAPSGTRQIPSSSGLRGRGGRGGRGGRSGPAPTMSAPTDLVEKPFREAAEVVESLVPRKLVDFFGDLPGPEALHEGLENLRGTAHSVVEKAEQMAQIADNLEEGFEYVQKKIESGTAMGKDAVQHVQNQIEKGVDFGRNIWHHITDIVPHSPLPTRSSPSSGRRAAPPPRTNMASPPSPPLLPSPRPDCYEGPATNEELLNIVARMKSEVQRFEQRLGGGFSPKDSPEYEGQC